VAAHLNLIMCVRRGCNLRYCAPPCGIRWHLDCFFSSGFFI